MPARVRGTDSWNKKLPVVPQEFSTILLNCSSIAAVSLTCEKSISMTNYIPCRNSWPWTSDFRELPSLTHLTLKQTVVSPELLAVIQHFGLQLVFLSVGSECMSMMLYMWLILPIVTMYFAVLMLAHLLDHFVFSSRRLRTQTKAIVFGICAFLIVSCFWWFKGLAFGVEGPMTDHWGLEWRKVIFRSRTTSFIGLTLLF